MNKQDIITDFSALGQCILAYLNDPRTSPALALAVQNSLRENKWFTPSTITLSLAAIATDMLDKQKLQQWLSACTGKEKLQKVVVVMAGNIPLVGFHDFLCVLASGNLFTGKLSHKDLFLLPALAGLLTDIRPEWSRRISFIKKCPADKPDRLIVTGSDPTARYFETWMTADACPQRRMLIRHSRRSVAILTAAETAADLNGLAEDILSYFGLGCRNVSMLYAPEGYDWQPLRAVLAAQEEVMRHIGYRHNYCYQKALLLMQQKPFIDASTVLLCEGNSWETPLSVVHFQYYKDKSELLASLEQQRDRLQCIVTGEPVNNKFCTFGATQHPQLYDYADGVNTMQWLYERENDEQLTYN